MAIRGDERQTEPVDPGKTDAGKEWTRVRHHSVPGPLAEIRP